MRFDFLFFESRAAAAEKGIAFLPKRIHISAAKIAFSGLRRFRLSACRLLLAQPYIYEKSRFGLNFNKTPKCLIRFAFQFRHVRSKAAQIAIPNRGAALNE